ncbi:uncharacterized protein LOC143915756 [Arctopsyche grandis]|uniref:uncharacterized protein LOC143915756 n=1 Tax=Arctopsyche grandis TaxID=121162 RepID=UPI00406D7F5C
MSLTIDNFKTLYKNQKIVNLPVSTLTDILKSDTLNVSAAEVFESVKLWIKFDETNRKSELVDLLSFVKLPSLSMEFLVKEVLLFCSPYAECIEIIQQAIESIFLNCQSKLSMVEQNYDNFQSKLSIVDHNLKDSQSKLSIAEQNFANSQSKLSIADQNLKDSQSKLSIAEQNFANSQSKLSIADQNLKDSQSKLSIAELKLNHCQIYKIALIGDLKNAAVANTFAVYDGRNDSWTLSRSFNFNRTEFSSVLVKKCIMIIGGIGFSTQVDYIDLKNGEMHSLKPLNQGRWAFSAVTHDHLSSSDVYVIGGFHEKAPLSSVERWKSNTMNWEKNVAPLLLAVHNHSASVIDDTIYVTGGRKWENKKEYTVNTMQVYSVGSNSWSSGTPMTLPRQRHSSISIKGKLFIGGGSMWETNSYKYIDSVESYDPYSKLWKNYCTLPIPASGISLCFFQNKLLSMGGYDGLTELSNVWEYNDVSRSWKGLKSLNEKRRLANTIVLPDYSII